MAEARADPPAIRRAGPDDAAALALLGGATMLETYTELVRGPDLVAHVRNKHAEAVYADWARDPDVCMWIAESSTKAPVGYLVLMPATLPTEGPVEGDLEVVRIYVLQRYHQTGLGHALMRLAVDEASARHASRVVLGVNSDNVTALAFYRRQGFEMIGRRHFVVGDAVFDDRVLGLRLC